MVQTKQATTKKKDANKPTNGATLDATSSKLTAEQLAELDSEEHEPLQTPEQLLNFFDKKERKFDLDETLLKLDKLNHLSDRRKKLLEAIDDVNQFTVSTTGENCSLRFHDSNSQSFSITNSAVILEIKEQVLRKLAEEVDAIEMQFQFTY